VMDQTTFTDPRIIHLLNTHFIPIRVDTDQRPDLEARYRAGGWPTINLLLPTGEILFQSNALTSEEMEAILKEVQSIYVTDKADLVKEASTLWNQMEEKVGASPFQGHVLETAMVEQSVQVIKQQYEPMNKGF